jgi:hypothetical protein
MERGSDNSRREREEIVSPSQKKRRMNDEEESILMPDTHHKHAVTALIPFADFLFSVSKGIYIRID